MGCVSSSLLNQDEEFSQIGGSGLGHHIVSLTSTTYGLLTLDPPSPSPTAAYITTQVPPTLRGRASLFPRPPFSHNESTAQPQPSHEVINSWELMAGLDTTAANASFRFSPPSKPLEINKENSNPNMIPLGARTSNSDDKSSSSSVSIKQLNNIIGASCYSLDVFEKLCPPNGENRVVIYTTSLRGVRRTFEDCNAVRSAMEGFGVIVCERDISMDRGFREELRELMKGKDSVPVPPRVFVKGRYVGGAQEVMRMVEQGCFRDLLKGLPSLSLGLVCEGCGGYRFLPCFACYGSCKIKTDGTTLVVRCPDCNENGLVLCPICTSFT